MALQKSIIFKKMVYPAAYIRVESVSIRNGEIVDGIKKYTVEVRYSVYADSEKDADLYDETINFTKKGYNIDERLTEEQATFSGVYSLLKEEIGDCIDV